MSDKRFYEEMLARHLGPAIEVYNVAPVSGGCINETVRIDSLEGKFFVKRNNLQEKDLFEKEALGLRLLRDRSSVKVPRVVGNGSLNNNVYLILQWIEKGPPNVSFWQEFGQALAAQHRVSSPHFGLDHDNHIGRLHQSNTQTEQWDDFFINQRLAPQLVLAKDHKLVDDKLVAQFERLLGKLGKLIPSEPPALLHGDLWSGNFLCSSSQEAYIFDPAVYYGHRETELAFTTLFGGFDQVFYDAYQEYFPLEKGFEDRIELHNLYPLLVHVNLFGPSYLSGIKHTLSRFV